MIGLLEAAADAAYALAAAPLEMLSAAIGRLADTMERRPPGSGRKDAAEAAFVRDRVITQVSEWLSAPARSALRDQLVLKLLPVTLTAIDESGLRDFIGGRIRTHLEGVDLAPAAAGLLRVVIEKRQHQRLLDDLLDALEKLLVDEEALDGVRGRLRAQLPALFNLYRGEPFVMRKLIAAVTAFVVEIRTDPDHALRLRLDEYAAALVERLRTSPELASRADKLKRDLLARPELVELSEDAWNGLRDFLVGDTSGEASEVRRHLELSRAE